MSLFSTLFVKKEETEEIPRRPDLSGILENLREGILIVSENKRIVFTNDTAVKAFARRGEELTDKRLSEVIRDFSLHEAVDKTLKSEKQIELRMEIIGNERKIYDVKISPLESEGKMHALAVFYDITRIENLERTRQEFLSNISHELRTPLTSILAFVETLEDGAIDDELNNRRFLNVIRKNAERMHLLIDDISELSSIEAGKIKVEIKKVNLHALVREIFTNLSTKAQEREIKLMKQYLEKLNR